MTNHFWSQTNLPEWPRLQQAFLQWPVHISCSTRQQKKIYSGTPQCGSIQRPLMLDDGTPSLLNTPLQEEFKSIHTANSRSGFTCGVDTPTLTYAFPGNLESGLAEFSTRIYLAISKEKTFPKARKPLPSKMNQMTVLKYRTIEDRKLVCFALKSGCHDALLV